MVFNTYQTIFNERGDSYHAAMQLSPDARQREFELIIELAELQSGQTVCDMPSGGGYLQNYVDDIDVELVLIEPSCEFHDRITLSAGNTSHLCQLDALPLNDGCIDAVISLAGLHHISDKLPVITEMHRVLRSGGRLCMADVREGSSVDNFLDVFVDRYSSAGHEGVFVNAGLYASLEKTGFELVTSDAIAYPWVFSSKETMATYCKMLFGIDQASVTEVLAAIEEYLGYEEFDGRCHMNWELEFIACLKQSADAM